MPDPRPPEPAPPSDDANAAPWERQSVKPTASLPGGATTGWHEVRKGKDRGKQIVATVGLFFCLVGLLGGLIYWMSRPQRTVELVAIPVSQYGAIKWGANPTADRDADKLLAQFEQGSGRGSSLQDGARLRKLLAGLAERDPNVPLVLFVSSLSIVRDDRVYLLPADAHIDQPKTWLPLADLLARFNECPATEKALLLDIARTPPDPFRGALHDDIATKIDQELAASNPTFPILASCSPGERSLTIPELGLSAFAEYVSQGLAGEADGYYSSKEADSVITFAELAEFAICRVSQWADQVPDARQVPKRYGPDGNGFILFRKRTRAALLTEDSPAPAPAPGYPNELRDAWKVRDAAKRDLGSLLAPDLILELEAALLQLEDRYLMGLETSDPRETEAWKTAVKRLANRTQVLDSPPPIRASLADYRAGRKDATPELIGALEKWMRMRFPPKDDTGKPPLPPNEAEREKFEQELEKSLQGDSALDGFWYLWNVKLVTGTGLSAERIANISATLDERFPKLPLTNEQLLLRRVAKEKLPPEAYPDVVRALLQSEQALSEAVAATAGRFPEGFTRVKLLLSEGHDAKVAGEKRLFTLRPKLEDIAAAREHFNSAAELLKASRNGANAVRAARRAWADGTAQLHACLPGTIEFDRPALRDWSDAADFANKIADPFAASDTPFEIRDFEALDGLAKQLRASMALKLMLISSEDIKALDQSAQLRPQTVKLADLQKLLGGAALAAEDRAMMAAGFRKVSAQRFHAAKARYEREAPVMKPAVRPEPLKASLRTQRRATASVELLRIAGHSEVEQIAGMARVDSNDYSKWQLPEERLRKAWTSDLPAMAELCAKQGRWVAIERILRALPAKIDGFDPEGGFGELFRKEETERRKWLAERFKEYGKLREGVPDAPGFYRHLVDDCDLPVPKGAR